MTATTAETTAPAGATPTESLTPTLRQRLRAGKHWLWIVPLALLIVVITFGSQMARAGGEKVLLDPTSPSQVGGKALVEVLRGHGIDVQLKSRSAELAAAVSDPASTTVLVHDRDLVLTSEQWQRLADLGVARIVVIGSLPDAAIDPDGAVLATGFATADTASDDPEVPSGSVPAGERCLDAIGTNARELSNLGGTTTTLGEGATGSQCYPAGSGYLVTMTKPKGTSTEIVTVASADPFTNSRIDDHNNAAAAIGLLGDTKTLVWYEPAPELADGSPDLGPGQYVPAWLTPAMLLLYLVVAAYAVARGRRLGRVVHERLPVVVRASETVEGRARLYQRAEARLRAADALRIGTLTRCARALGLDAGTPAHELADAIAQASGMSRERAHYILLTANPTSDTDLVQLSDELLTLERTITTPLSGMSHDPSTTNGAHDVR